ncbi:MAG: hypothetical protein M5R36_00255 [Deltaproteobacteria bacterium]|nr:hypothetical protein [Deltaproteobacteria bacterium]
MNEVVAKRCGCTDLFVFGAMGDSGLCVGAALDQAAHGDHAGRHLFLGPEPGDGKPGGSGLDEEAIRRVAAMIDAGRVVALVTGRMEFGPRALGHRSLLFSPKQPETAGMLSRALNRPAVMPYAPAVRAEDYGKVTADPAWAATRDMTVTVTAKPGIAEKYPVAVHTDGSMRLQRVARDETPLLHDILSALASFDTPPLAINTSFNRHTEPIVRGAERAFALFESLPIDALVLNETLWEKRP